MMFKIVKDHIVHNPKSRPGTKRPVTRALIYHWTGVPGQSAIGVRNYFGSLKENDPSSSANYSVDENDIVEIIPPEEVSYQSGTGNVNDYTRIAKDYVGIPPWLYSIGVELCVLDKKGTFSEQTLVNGIWLGDFLCKRFMLNPRFCVFRHFDITGKVCPKRFVDYPKEWEEFKGEIYDLYGVKQRS